MNGLGNKAVMGENITHYMKINGIDRSQLAKALDIPYTTLTDWIKGNTYPRIDKIEQLARYFGIAKADLVEERSSGNAIFSERSWGEPILDAYAATTRPKQEAVCTVLDIPHVIPGVTDNTLAEEEEEDPDPFRVSMQDAAAGTGVYLGPEEFTTIYVVAGCLPTNASFGVPVSGNSMEPEYYDGDILIVSKEKAEIGQVGVFTMDGYGYVKILRDGYLESLNPAYDDIPMEEGIICNGAVIGVLDRDCIVEE